jgi:hypothetical protein
MGVGTRRRGDPATKRRLTGRGLKKALCERRTFVFVAESGFERTTAPGKDLSPAPADLGIAVPLQMEGAFGRRRHHLVELPARPRRLPRHRGHRFPPPLCCATFRADCWWFRTGRRSTGRGRSPNLSARNGTEYVRGIVQQQAARIVSQRARLLGVAEAREIIEAWRLDYNHYRSHCFFSSLNRSLIGLSSTIISMVSHKRLVSTIAFRVHMARYRLLELLVFTQTNSEAGPGLGEGGRMPVDARRPSQGHLVIVITQAAIRS